MKKFKTLIIVALLIISSTSFAQEEQTRMTETDEIIQIDETIFSQAESLKVGDVIILQKTPHGFYSYVIMDEERTNSLKRGTKLMRLASEGLTVAGLNTGSLSTLETARKVGNATYMAEYGLKVNDFINKKQETREVVIDSLYNENLYGLDEIVANFKIKRKAYKVYLKMALTTNEIKTKEN